MDIKHYLVGILLLATSINPCKAGNNTEDSLRIVDIEQIVVVASPKENTALRRQAVSSSLFSQETLENVNIRAINSLSGYAPNFYMPSYGSKQTSAIYIRGIGSRINTPAVALYMDDIPIVDKSTYTVQQPGINRIDILRGPQGTLYGRNAMGGILKLYTDNPFTKQGTQIQMGASTRDRGTHISTITNQKLTEKLALSLGAFYQNSQGVFRNDTLGKKVDRGDEVGARLRLVYHPTRQWKLDFNSSYEYIDQSPYPYFYKGSTTDFEPLPNIIDQITANRESKYRRSSLIAGLTAAYQAHAFTVSSITSYQNLNDRMMMDQDFIYQDYYTLSQKQQSNAFTEEIIFKSLPMKRWEWTGGLFGLWQNLHTTAPVTFYADGIGMLNNTLGQVLPNITYTNPFSGQPLSISQKLMLTDSGFPIGGRFSTPVLNGAAYFLGVLHDLFLPKLSLTLGLRLDYEHQELKYAGGDVPVNYLYSMQMIQPANLSVCPSNQGKIKDDHTRLLPKISFQYDLDNDIGNIYATVSQGHRSGGYNIQMFSDIMRSIMQIDMIGCTKDYCDNLLLTQANNAPTPAMQSMFLGIKQTMDENIPQYPMPDVRETVTYKPEYCWNYEIGTHLNFIERTLTADLSAFFMDTRDQQISRFTNSGMGRIMVNAGNSHSCGLEASLKGNFFNNHLNISLNYGYTHAVFRHYDTGDTHDYSGNQVPFVPDHNMGLMADYVFPINKPSLKSITLGINTNGYGRIYWTEDNNAYQNFYATLGAHATLDFGIFTLNVWGKNLTQTHYEAFYFESINRGFYQKGNPLQLGIDLSLHL